MMSQIMELIVAVRSELALFVIAFGIHYVIFGGYKANHPNPLGKKRISVPETDSTTSTQQQGNNGTIQDFNNATPEQLLQKSQDAFDQGDYRNVLRVWASLKKHDMVPFTHFACVLESMQRLKRDSASTLAEATAFLRRRSGKVDIQHVNDLLDPLAKSLDSELVMGLIGQLPILKLSMDERSYDILLTMHFATRNFSAVESLAGDMASKGLTPSTRASLVLLKTALRTGNLQEAIAQYRAVASTPSGRGTAPQHLSAQLVELGCRERNAGAVLTELEASDAQLTTDALNSLLAEAARSDGPDLSLRVTALAGRCTASLNGRSYQLLIKAAGQDKERIAKLLDELSVSKVEWGSDVAAAVLAACGSDHDMMLADKLSGMISANQSGQIPVLGALIRFYAEAGTPDKACAVYDKNLQSLNAARGGQRRSLLDSRTERSLAASALECGRSDLTQGLFDAGPVDTAKHIAMIRTCAAKGNLDGAFSVFAGVESAHGELSHSLYNSVLDACVECRSLDRAETWMQRMKKEGVADVVSYNTLIKPQLKSERYDRARHLMSEMREAGCSPNHVTYNEFINSLVRNDRPNHQVQVWEVISEMEAEGVKPNRVTCSILLKNLKANSNQKDVLRTMDLVNAMEEPMDEVLLSSVVEACVRVGKPDLLLKKLEHLQASGKMVSVCGAHTFGSLIKAYGHAKDIAGVWRCWKEMRSRHVKPTSITIGCMVEAVVSNGDVEGGYELIQDLFEDENCREQVNAVIYCSVLKGYARSRRMERVWTVWNEMLSRNIEPSVATFNAMIDACARNSRMDAVPELLTSMKSRGLVSNLITYSTTIKGFCQRGEIQAAFSVLDEMRRVTSLKPDEIVYNTLLDGCAQGGLVSEGERLLEDMQKEGIVPSSYTLTVLVKLMGQARRPDRAFSLVEEISHKYRFQPNAHVYAGLAQACLTARDHTRAMQVFDQMARDRMQVEGRVWQALVRMSMAAHDYKQAAYVCQVVLGVPSNDGFRPVVSVGRANDDAFIKETLNTLMQAGGEAAAAAAPLLKRANEQGPRPQPEPTMRRTTARTGILGRGRGS